jgi:hypothetical protein
MEGWPVCQDGGLRSAVTVRNWRTRIVVWSAGFVDLRTWVIARIDKRRTGSLDRVVEIWSMAIKRIIKYWVLNKVGSDGEDFWFEIGSGWIEGGNDGSLWSSIAVDILNNPWIVVWPAGFVKLWARIEAWPVGIVERWPGSLDRVVKIWTMAVKRVVKNWILNKVWSARDDLWLKIGSRWIKGRNDGSLWSSIAVDILNNQNLRCWKIA